MNTVSHPGSFTRRNSSLLSTATMVQIAGKYKRTKCENYDEFLSKVGVGFLLRKAATASTPTMEIVDLGGGKWKVTTATTMKSMSVEFEFDKAFDEETPDGRSVKTTMSKESDTKWVLIQKDKKGGKDVRVVRNFEDGGINIEYSCDGVVSKQYFSRQ